MKVLAYVVDKLARVLCFLSLVVLLVTSFCYSWKIISVSGLESQGIPEVLRLVFKILNELNPVTGLNLYDLTYKFIMIAGFSSITYLALNGLGDKARQYYKINQEVV